MRTRVIAAAVGLLAALGTSRSAAAESSWRVTEGDVRVVCPLTVGGSFEARTAALTGSVSYEAGRPGFLSGALSADLKTLDTGIGLRNDHLANQYLEVAKGDGFDRAILSELRLASVDSASFQGKSAFTGTLLLHGTARAVKGHATIRREGELVRVEATFAVALSEFAIAKPQYLGVGVRNEVQVKVSLLAASEAGR